MPTALEQVRILTYDPGARLLATLLDELTARVDACCSSSVASTARPTPAESKRATDEPPPASRGPVLPEIVPGTEPK